GVGNARSRRLRESVHTPHPRSPEAREKPVRARSRAREAASSFSIRRRGLVENAESLELTGRLVRLRTRMHINAIVDHERHLITNARTGERTSSSDEAIMRADQV